MDINTTAALSILTGFWWTHCKFIYLKLPCLVLSLKGKVFNLSPLSIMLDVRYFIEIK